MTGKIIGSGKEYPLIHISKYPNKIRYEIFKNNDSYTTLFDGESGCRVDLSGNVQNLSKMELNNLKADCEIGGIIYNCIKKGYKVEADGATIVDDIPVYKVKITSKKRLITIFYIDKKNFIVVKKFTKLNSGNGYMEVYVDDYREVGGITLGFHEIVKVNGLVYSEVVIDKVTFNE